MVCSHEPDHQVDTIIVHLMRHGRRPLPLPHSSSLWRNIKHRLKFSWSESSTPQPQCICMAYYTVQHRMILKYIGVVKCTYICTIVPVPVRHSILVLYIPYRMTHSPSHRHPRHDQKTCRFGLNSIRTSSQQARAEGDGDYKCEAHRSYT